MKKKVGILIDSSSTFDPKFIKENHIWIVPLTISDAQFKVYKDDEKELSRKKLINRLKNGENFKTSMTPIGELTKIVEQMFKQYESIIFIPISKGLSSQWQMSQIIKKEYSNFHVVNSTSAAYVNEIVTRKVVDDIKLGESIGVIIRDAEKIYEKTFSIFSVEDTSGMKSGGRITSAILKVIDFMNMQPIIRLNCSNEYAGITRNFYTGISKMVKATRDWCKEIDQKTREVCIYFSGYNKTKLEFIKRSLCRAFNINKNKICIRWIPSTVLVHTKLGSYGYTVLAR